MAHGVFWYGKVQKMNMNGPLADTTMLRSIFYANLGSGGMIVDTDEVVAWAELFKDETFTAE